MEEKKVAEAVSGGMEAVAVSDGKNEVITGGKTEVNGKTEGEASGARLASAELIGGKFRSVDALLQSYNNLEAEFSRRTARLKELEATARETAEADLWERKLTDFFGKYPFAREYGAKIGDYVEQHGELVTDEICLERALLAVLSEQRNSSLGDENVEVGNLVNDKVGKSEQVRENKNEPARKALEQVQVAPPRLLSSGGSLPPIAPKRPRTIMEAGQLALDMLTKTIK